MKEAPIIIVILLMLLCILVGFYQINESDKIIENQAELIDSLVAVNKKSYDALIECNGFLKHAVETNKDILGVNEFQREQIYYLSQKHY